MMSFGWGGFGFLYMFIFLLLVLALAVWLVRSLFPQTGSRDAGSTPPQGAGGQENPLEIARRRYARGDINREEYEEMRRVLQDSPV